jgi:hypothetical protein
LKGKSASQGELRAGLLSGRELSVGEARSDEAFQGTFDRPRNFLSDGVAKPWVLDDPLRVPDDHADNETRISDTVDVFVKGAGVGGTHNI